MTKQNNVLFLFFSIKLFGGLCFQQKRTNTSKTQSTLLGLHDVGYLVKNPTAQAHCNTNGGLTAASLVTWYVTDLPSSHRDVGAKPHITPYHTTYCSIVYRPCSCTKTHLYSTPTFLHLDRQTIR